GPTAAPPGSRRVSLMDRARLRSQHTAAVIDDEIERLAVMLEGTDDAEGRADIHDEMVLCALPFADSIARRYRHRGIDGDDLVQVARLAVVKAVRRYRHGAGPGFTAYAAPTIYGEIKR